MLWKAAVPRLEVLKAKVREVNQSDLFGGAAAGGRMTPSPAGRGAADQLQSAECRMQNQWVANRGVGKRGRKVSDELVRLMHADYSTGMALNAVGRKYGRSRNGVRNIFHCRGLFVRPFNAPSQDPKTGRILPFVPKTAAEITALIRGLKRVSVPAALKLEWRRWSMDRRRDFIRRARYHLNQPGRPGTPFSSNVTPFEYGSPAAMAIEAKLNRGTNSRTKRIKIKPCSQGVIYRGKLYFWTHGAKYTSGMGWSPTIGRPSLHHIIWEEHHGGKVPAGQTVIFLDGNNNNLAPENLGLRSRADCARENRMLSRSRNSRVMVALLLKKQTSAHDGRANKKHEHFDSLKAVRQRGAGRKRLAAAA